MLVTLADGQVVDFHFLVNHRKRGNHETVCELAVRSQDGSKPQILFHGRSRCNPIDRYNKVTGKVLALRKVMLVMRAFPVFDRAARKAVWGEFYRHMAQCPDIQTLSGYREYLEDGRGKPLAQGV